MGKPPHGSVWPGLGEGLRVAPGEIAAAFSVCSVSAGSQVLLASPCVLLLWLSRRAGVAPGSSWPWLSPPGPILGRACLPEALP